MASAKNAIVTASTLPRRAVSLALMEPGNDNQAVMVKLMRKWKVWPSYGGPIPKSLELVFVDLEGTTIQGHIERMHMYKHEKLLHEGKVYLISKFEVGINLGKFRATRHNYILKPTFDTLIRPAARSDIIPDDPAIVFTPPAECFESGFNMDYLVDVAGLLTGVHAEIPFNRPNFGNSTRMKIDLDNRG